MKTILVLNGPNLNLLGERDSVHYGTQTMGEINEALKQRAEELGVKLGFFQSNHEGDLIDRLHEARHEVDGIIINPGALTHYSYALRDAIEAVGLPTVEVHLSDIASREEFRRVSVISPVASKVITGKGGIGYLEALDFLVAELIQ